MTIPDYQTLMLPVLRLAAEREQRVADVVDRVVDEFGLRAEERQTMLAILRRGGLGFSEPFEVAASGTSE